MVMNSSNDLLFILSLRFLFLDFSFNINFIGSILNGMLLTTLNLNLQYRYVSQKCYKIPCLPVGIAMFIKSTEFQLLYSCTQGRVIHTSPKI